MAGPAVKPASAAFLPDNQLNLTDMETTNKAFRIKDVRVFTYDGHTLDMQISGIFHGPRIRIEDAIIDSMRKVMKNDIPVSATFKMIPL